MTTNWEQYKNELFNLSSNGNYVLPGIDNVFPTFIPVSEAEISSWDEDEDDDEEDDSYLDMSNGNNNFTLAASSYQGSDHGSYLPVDNTPIVSNINVSDWQNIMQHQDQESEVHYQLRSKLLQAIYNLRQLNYTVSAEDAQRYAQMKIKEILHGYSYNTSLENDIRYIDALLLRSYA